MPLEIEVKCPLQDPRPLRRRLRELGARRESTEHHRNITLDTRAKLLRKTDKLLRVRLVSGRALVTYKGPKQKGRVKRREEIEYETGEPEGVLALFRRLGYEPSWTYEGTREHYRLGRALVTIDRMARLGWFCEVEAPSERLVLETARRLDLPKGKLTTKSYRELAEEHFAHRGQPLRDLTFR